VQRIVGDQRRWTVVRAAVATRPAHGGRCPSAERPPDEGGTRDDGWERHAEQGQREERRDRQRDECGMAQRLLADAHHGLCDDGQYRGCEPGEQGGDDGGLTETDVDRRQAEQCHNPGEHEQGAGDQATAHPVEEPADVDGQLLGLRAGQQCAVRQGVQEPPLPDPALLIDQGALHDRDLPGRAAERLQRDREPRPDRLTEWDDIT
jgi:hypothetical protein